MAQLWGGRFTKETDKLVYDFNASINFDKRLFEQDIEGSIAHVVMLEKQGILTCEEKDQIVKGLTQIREDVRDGKLTITSEYEDIHSFVEANLIDRIGDAGKKMHTGRSRNDQVAFKGDSDNSPYDYGDESSHLYAGFYPFTEGTADHAGPSYGSLL